MHIPRFSHLILAALLYCNIPGWSASATTSASKTVVSTDQVRAELMAHAPQGIGPAQEVWVGLQLSHQPEWHTYWKNAGDSGLPTSLEWILPPGISAGDIAWPTPHKITIGNLVNYGYDGKVLLPVPLQIAPNFKPNLLNSDLEIQLKASWLVCRKECIPQEGEFSLKIPLKSSTALNSVDFSQAFAAQPKELKESATMRVSGQELHLSVQGLPPHTVGKRLELFPESPEITAPATAWRQSWDGSTWNASVPLSPQRSQAPNELAWVLSEQGGSYRAVGKVSGAWPAELTPEEIAAAQSVRSISPAASSADIGLLAALMGALIGGLILNLMPCVFPILAIKVMGFTQHAHDHQAHRLSGLAYTAGVVLSFLALGALMLALRATGEQLGWGFQLQSPAMIAGLAILFTAIGLSLTGLYAFGQLLPDRLVNLQSSNPSINAFLSGMLAVAVASPCTAPFMGASLGFAIAMPPAQALAVFVFLGLGMALPYLLASWVPAIANMLPRPGAWMETFRSFMAFPMFGTVIWLVWVLGQQTGIDGVTALLTVLLTGAAALWTANLAGKTSRVAGGILWIAALWLLGPQVIKETPSFTSPSSSSSSLWQAWEPGKLEQLLADNQTVFVDFTAAWCVTCQYNKKTTLSNGQVLADLQAKNVHLMRADWTRRDPAISATLAALGRSGVPVYVFYQRGRPPLVLSEVLAVEDFRKTVAQL